MIRSEPWSGTLCASKSDMFEDPHLGRRMPGLRRGHPQSGSHGTELIGQEDFGKMVALRGDSIVPVPLADAVASPKLVDPTNKIIRSTGRLGISFGDECFVLRQFARPGVSRT